MPRHYGIIAADQFGDKSYVHNLFTLCVRIDCAWARSKATLIFGGWVDALRAQLKGAPTCRSLGRSD